MGLEGLNLDYTQSIINFYGDANARFVRAKYNETEQAYEECVLNGKMDYKTFLKSNPHVLYNQRRGMLYKALKGYTTSSKATREACIYDYVFNKRRENTKLHQILFVDDACIFPDLYNTLFIETDLNLVYIKLMYILALDLEISTDELASLIAFDISKYMGLKLKKKHDLKNIPRIKKLGVLFKHLIEFGENPFKDIVESYDYYINNSNGYHNHKGYLATDILDNKCNTDDTIYNIKEAVDILNDNLVNFTFDYYNNLIFDL